MIIGYIAGWREKNDTFSKWYSGKTRRRPWVKKQGFAHVFWTKKEAAAALKQWEFMSPYGPRLFKVVAKTRKYSREEVLAWSRQGKLPASTPKKKKK